jgi:hypothetical protein
MSFAATGQLNMSQIFIFCDIFFWKSSEKGSERRAGKAESVEKTQLQIETFAKCHKFHIPE